MDFSDRRAARALGAGDALGALKRVRLRDDPPALALRGIAMAQLGEHPRRASCLRAPRAASARTRTGACALRGRRGRGGAGDARPRRLDAHAGRGSATLEARADRANALHAR
jgi:hypothetical protein